MSKYEQLISKIQALKDISCSGYYLCPNITSEEWELLEEALITIQFLEVIFAVRMRNLKKDHE